LGYVLLGYVIGVKVIVRFKDDVVSMILIYISLLIFYSDDILQANAFRDGVHLTTNATGILEASSSMLKQKVSARLTVQLHLCSRTDS